MFMFDGLLTIVIIGVLLFILYTLINIYDHIRHFSTSLLFLMIFFDFLLVMPIKYVDYAYKNRNKFLERYSKKPRTKQDKDYFKKVHASKIRIFLYYYKRGTFSYDRTMNVLIQLYNAHPYQLTINNQRRIHKRKSELEKKYLRGLSSKVLLETRV